MLIDCYYLFYHADIFRPFAGYSSLRILTKESKQVPNRQYHLCFVEFDNKHHATVSMQVCAYNIRAHTPGE